jgi:DNA polymerase-3 subunit gamma/tau
LALLAREAEGSLRDAQSLLEQVLATGTGTVDEAEVREVVGGADRRLVLDVADAVLDGDAPRALRALRALYDHGYDARRFCRDLLEHVRHLAVVQATGDRTLLAGLPDAEVERVAGQGAKRSAEDLLRAFRVLLDADEALAVPSRTIDPQLVLEMAVLRLATLPSLVPIDELARRLESLAGGGTTGATRASAGVAGPSRPAAPAAALAAAPVGTADADRLWAAILERLQTERVALYMALIGARALGIGGGVLRLGLDNEAMRREVGRKEAADALRAIATSVAGSPLAVDVGPLPAERAQETVAAQSKRRAEETLADPLVQAAVEIFGAEVRGVRDRRA